MGITDVDFLRANTDIAMLFSCQTGLDCSADGNLMKDLCFVDEKSCGLSYDSWLSRKITVNQYADYLNAIQVINSIINSDWFEQRDILNSTDL